MAEDSYSLKEMISEFRGDVNKQLGIIDGKVTATNGRLRKLEAWQWFMKGGLLIISVFLIPLLIYVWNQNINTEAKLQSLIVNKVYESH